MHCGNAGCSELYIVWLVFGTSHAVPRVSALHYHVNVHTNGEGWIERQQAVAQMHKHTDGIVAFIKELWLCRSPWLCSFVHSAEWHRGLNFPVPLGSPVRDERRGNVKYNAAPHSAFRASGRNDDTECTTIIDVVNDLFIQGFSKPFSFCYSE